MGKPKSKQYFVYGEKELEYLKNRDKKLGALIDDMGFLESEVTPDLFAALVESVISQQISDKASASIHRRLTEITEITAEKIDALPLEDVQKCGLSFRKAGYIKNVAKAIISKEFEIEKLKTMNDREIINELTKIKGIGVWTAEMMLIFSFERRDIISYGDLGIRRNMMKLYGLKELPKEKFERYARRYSPYASIASLYIWAMSDEKKAAQKL
jgi:3-methyladenine DNA glycosylase/8-oxoguanine DNA glycosylase